MLHHIFWMRFTVCTLLKVGRWWLGLDPLRHIIVPVSASSLVAVRQLSARQLCHQYPNSTTVTVLVIPLLLQNASEAFWICTAVVKQSCWGAQIDSFEAAKYEAARWWPSRKKNRWCFRCAPEVFVWQNAWYVWPICLKHLPSSKQRVVKWNLKQVEWELRSRDIGWDDSVASPWCWVKGWSWQFATFCSCAQVSLGRWYRCQFYCFTSNCHWEFPRTAWGEA